MRTQRGVRAAFLLVWGLLWAAGGALAGDQPSADKLALEKIVFDSLRDMHNQAADLYNSGDANGAYRMFQGGLMIAKPLLAHRPEVQLLIDQGMQNAERQASVPQRAKLLHETIEGVRNQLRPPKPPDTPKSNAPPPPPTSGGTPPNPIVPPPVPPRDLPGAGGPTPTLPPPPGASLPLTRTLWERLGGEAAVTKIVDTLLTLTIDDKSINFTRDGKFKMDREKEAALKLKMVGFISDLSNGTVVYTGKSMAEAHQGMNIQGKEFDDFVKSLRMALETNGVKLAEVEELLDKVKAIRKDIVTAPGGGQ